MGDKKMSHTPGPWGVESFALSEEIIAMGRKLVAIVQSRHCESPEEMRANAHIIAAAPDLLAVSEEVLATATVETPPRLVAMAEAALAKARAET